MKNFDWEKYITQCLNSTQFCALGTLGGEGVWVNPVYFAFDESLNIYFISQPDSKHMKNIEKNPEVSLAIYSTAQEPKGDVYGMQVLGEAKVIKDVSEAEEAHKVYFTATEHHRPVDPAGPAPTFVGESAEWVFVKITLTKMYYFDTRFFGETRQEVPLPL